MPTRPKRRNVTFELPEGIYEALKEDSERVGEKSLHQRARLLIIDYFSTTPLTELSCSVQEQGATLDHLVDLVRRLAYATLVRGSSTDEEVSEAEEWIRSQMPRSPERMEA